MNHQFTRRQFLSLSLVSGSLMVCMPATQSYAARQKAEHKSKLTPLVKIYPDNRIKFYSPSPDMGQGVDKSLAMLFLEELDGDMDQVSVEPMRYMITKDAEGKIQAVAVPQFAGGSTSIPRNFTRLREAGAGLRQLIVQAAAKKLGVPADDLKTQSSFVITPSGKRIAYGDLIGLAEQESLPDDFKPQLKNREDWSLIGQEKASVQTRKIITGQPLYGMDMDYPGAKTALISRCPFSDGYVESVNKSAVEKLPGVHAVVVLDRPDLDKYYTYLAAGVAVVADDFWTAKKARDLLQIKWNKGPYQNESTEALNQQCDELLAGQGQIVRDDGDYEAAIKNADRVITRTYHLPLVAHAQMEPQNCIAHVEKDGCTIIGPMQSPGGASRMAAEITGFDRLAIDIRYTRLGGGFGRRLNSDHVAEAVMVSKLSGLPVKLLWTREDDMSHDFYRPMGRHQVVAAVDKQGKVTAWAHRLAGTPKHYRRNGKKPEEMYDADMYIDDFPANLVENLRYEYLLVKCGVPQGSWRAPAHTANAFVIQSFLDELAEETGRDPLQLRLDMLGEARELEYRQHGGPVFDTGRMANVLQQAARMADWGKKMPDGYGLGLSGHFTFGGYCAQVAEVQLLGESKFKVHKVYASIDAGTVIDPAGVREQVEGGINDGLSSALGQAVVFEQGQVVTQNFDTYHMARIADSVPHIEVHIVDSDADPSGVGEMGLPPLSAAVANAIKAAGGKRLRSHPFRSA